MKLHKMVFSLLLLLALSGSAFAQNRFIVRDIQGAGALQLVCTLLGCQVQGGLGDPLGQVFVVTGPLGSTLSFASRLLGQFGITNVEVDQLVKVMQSGAASTNTPGLYDRTPVNYYGTTVWNGYVNQPAAQIVRVPDTHSNFNVAGTGIVAVIDTGVDPSHPMLKNVIVPGYDFTRNQAGIPDERADVSSSSVAVLDSSSVAVLDGGGQPTILNSSSVAVLDSSSVAVLDSPQYAAFGHGTIVSGVIHLVAPRAMIMPLKAFHSDGSANLSDIVRAVYFAQNHNAKVIHMSFSFPSYSLEMYLALQTANLKGIVAVASTGNDGQKTTVYPAGYQGVVMGVASTNNQDVRSTFSNYGPQITWLAAPGENIVSAYPFGTYAAASGTSFSAPMVSGAAALLLDRASANELQAAGAVAHAKALTPDLGNGRLDLFQALAAWSATHK